MTLREWLLLTLEQPDPDLQEVELLAHAALEARRAGVRPELSDLADPAERLAWIAAGRELEVERALRAAEALRDPTVVIAELDGGAQYHAIQAQATARAVAALARERRHGA